MKLFLIPGLIMLSCGSVKSTQSVAKDDSVVVGNATAKDSLPQVLQGKTISVEGLIPACIKHKVDSFKVAQKHQQPQKIVEYLYKGKKVYYVVMPCCDFFNEVYDEKCKLLGSPDGGFTGKGDGKLPDFFKEARNEKLIWEAGN